MGRGSSNKGAGTLVDDTRLARHRQIRTPVTKRRLPPSERYREFLRQHLNVHYLDTDEAVKKAAERVKELDPHLVSLDFETASKNGRWGVLNGSLRLIQIGLDEPERSIAPQQLIIDCHRTDPRPFLGLLRDNKVEKQIHNMKFEQEWSLAQLGVSIGNIYDTLIAWRMIQKRLDSLSVIDAQKISPGWKKHDNKLNTLIKKTLDIKIPKTEQSGHWGRTDLAPEQIVYAAMDVATLPPLVTKTKRIAHNLDLDEDIDLAIARAKNGVGKRLQKRDLGVNDDSARVREAIMRSRDRTELDRVLTAARQMSVIAENRAELIRLAKARRSHLAQAT